jgi:hypothetical protein
MPHEPLMIDYPERGEKIASNNYTFRIGALADLDRVEVSVNDSSWQDCRTAEGYWWYDWSGYEAGSHELVARGRLRNGRTFTSEPRKFRVALETAPKTERFDAKTAEPAYSNGTARSMPDPRGQEAASKRR